jgi:hypothetical protein
MNDSGTPTDGGGGDGGNRDGGDGGSGIIVGVDDGGFPAPDGGGVRFDPDAGGITLERGSSNYYFAWIANSNDGTVSKYDTKTAREVARYYSVIPRDGHGVTLSGIRSDNFNSPSRTAIDLSGDVWVANRAPTVQGTVTKIATDLASCRHSLPDGGSRTSRDLNGNGMIETDPDAGEFIVPSNAADPSTYDDCVLFSTPVGGSFAAQDVVKVRGLAISAGTLESGSAGTIWATHWAENNVYKLRSSDGQIIAALPDGGMTVHLSWGGGCPQAPYCDGPYGAAADGAERLWVVDTTGAVLALINTRTGNLISDQLTPPVDGGFGVDPATYGSYGIAIDGRADGGSPRVWLAGLTTGMAPSGTALGTAWRYDHGPGLSSQMGTWTLFSFPNARSQTGSSFGAGRGIAADVRGYVWMSGSLSNIGSWSGGVAQLIGFNQENGAILPFHLADGGTADFIDVTDGQTNTSIGVGLDSDDNIWVNNYSGNAMKVYRDGGMVTLTGSQPGGNLYTYSDFTGYQLRNFTVLEGNYIQYYCGCPNARWGPATWVADTPPGTMVRLFVRVAGNAADLDNTNIPETGPYDMSHPMPVVIGTCMRARFNLVASPDRQRAPVLRSFLIPVDCQLG